MYFLGTLEKILEGSSKLEEIIVSKKEEAPKVYQTTKNSNGFKKSFDKQYKKGEYKKQYPPKDVKPSQSTEEPPSRKKANNCYGVFVRDGDTFEAMYNGKRVCFRLAGIDCPEINQPFGASAKEFLRKKVVHKVVYLDFKGQDLYKREIVEVFEDKEMKNSINKQLLQEGLATSERYKNNDGELTHNIIEHLGNKISEVGANFNDKGIWADVPVTTVQPLKVIKEEDKPQVSISASVKRKFPK